MARSGSSRRVLNRAGRACPIRIRAFTRPHKYHCRASNDNNATKPVSRFFLIRNWHSATQRLKNGLCAPQARPNVKQHEPINGRVRALRLSDHRRDPSQIAENHRPCPSAPRIAFSSATTLNNCVQVTALETAEIDRFPPRDGGSFGMENIASNRLRRTDRTYYCRPRRKVRVRRNIRTDKDVVAKKYSKTD